MDKYLLVFYGGKIAPTADEAKKSMDAWMKWFADMGKAVVDAGNPTMPGKVLSKKSTKAGFIGEQPVTGYSIIKAASLDKAAELAKTCPIINDGGQIAVYSIVATM